MSFAPESRFPDYISPYIVSGMYTAKYSLPLPSGPQPAWNIDLNLKRGTQFGDGSETKSQEKVTNAWESTQLTCAEEHMVACEIGRCLMTALAEKQCIRIDRPYFAVVYPGERANFEEAATYMWAQKLIPRLKTMTGETLIDELHQTMRRLQPKNSVARTAELYLCKYDIDELGAFFERLSRENTALYREIRLHGVVFDRYPYCTAYAKLGLSVRGPLQDCFLECALPHNVKLEYTMWGNALVNGLAQGHDPLFLAAWAFTSYMRIAPYAQGNETLAFMVMNAILMNAGLKPVSFPFFQDYKAALVKDLAGDCEAFEAFLRERVVHTNLYVCPDGEGLQRLSSALKKPLRFFSQPALQME